MSHLPTLEEEPELLPDAINVSETIQTDHIKLPDKIMEYQDYTKKQARKLWKYMKEKTAIYIQEIEKVPKDEYKTILHSVKNFNLEQKKEYSTYSLDNDL